MIAHLEIEQFDWPVIGSALLVVVLLSRILWGIWLLWIAMLVLLGRPLTSRTRQEEQRR